MRTCPSLCNPKPARHTPALPHRNRLLGLITLWLLLALVHTPAPAQTPMQNNYVITAPVTPASNGRPVMHTLQATWNTNVLELRDLGSIAYPQGWTLQYQANGSWSTTPPARLQSISGLLTTGTFISAGVGVDGTQSGQQLIVGKNHILVPATPGTFAIPTHGDGWDVFFDPTHTQVFNIYHHGSPAKIDCHERASGATCNGWPDGGIAVPAGNTNNRSTGMVLGDGRIFIPGGNGQFGGFSCVTTLGTNCPTAFYALTRKGRYVQDSVGDLVAINHRLYAWDLVASQLLCFDPERNQACAGRNPWSPPPAVSKTKSGFETARIIGDNKRVFGFFRSIDPRWGLFCYDTVQGRSCDGWGASKITRFQPALLVPIAKNGVVFDSVCYADKTNAYCYNAAGKNVAPSQALQSALTGTNMTYTGHYGNAAISQGRTYWTSPFRSQLGCYDATTDKVCGSATVYALNSASAYTVAPDPSIPNCVWTNSDRQGIQTWDASGSTLKENCAGIPPTIVFSADSSNLRLACPSDHALSTWLSYQISGASGASSATLTVLDTSGSAIPDWSDIPAGNAGQSLALANGKASWDLSALSILQTGQSPKFQVVLPGATANAPVTASVIAAGNPPELCWSAYTKRQPANPTMPNVDGTGEPTSLISILIDGVDPNAAQEDNGETPPTTPTFRRQTWIRLR